MFTHRTHARAGDYRSGTTSSRLGVCVLLWYSFGGAGISCWIRGLVVFSRNTRPTLSHEPWAGLIPAGPASQILRSGSGSKAGP